MDETVHFHYLFKLRSVFFQYTFCNYKRDCVFYYTHVACLAEGKCLCSFTGTVSNKLHNKQSACTLHCGKMHCPRAPQAESRIWTTTSKELMGADVGSCLWGSGTELLPRIRSWYIMDPILQRVVSSLRFQIVLWEWQEKNQAHVTNSLKQK